MPCFIPNKKFCVCLAGCVPGELVMGYQDLVPPGFWLESRAGCCAWKLLLLAAVGQSMGNGLVVSVSLPAGKQPCHKTTTTITANWHHCWQFHRRG